MYYLVPYTDVRRRVTATLILTCKYVYYKLFWQTCWTPITLWEQYNVLRAQTGNYIRLFWKRVYTTWLSN